MNGSPRYIAALRDSNGANLAALQAQDFAAAYEILDQRPNTRNGFSATVFRDSGQYILAIRGTETSIANGATDWLRGNGDIGTNGIAISQAIDLFNFYQELTAQGG